jgi:hypothetical protein
LLKDELLTFITVMCVTAARVEQDHLTRIDVKLLISVPEIARWSCHETEVVSTDVE